MWAYYQQSTADVGIPLVWNSDSITSSFCDIGQVGALLTFLFEKIIPD
jgi:hypothetical protein